MKFPYNILINQLGIKITLRKFDTKVVNYETGEVTKTVTESPIKVLPYSNKLKFVHVQTSQVKTYDFRIVYNKVLAVDTELTIDGKTYKVLESTKIGKFIVYLYYLRLV